MIEKSTSKQKSEIFWEEKQTWIFISRKKKFDKERQVFSLVSFGDFSIIFWHCKAIGVPFGSSLWSILHGKTSQMIKWEGTKACWYTLAQRNTSLNLIFLVILMTSRLLIAQRTIMIICLEEITDSFCWNKAAQIYDHIALAFRHIK